MQLTRIEDRWQKFHRPCLMSWAFLTLICWVAPQFIALGQSGFSSPALLTQTATNDVGGDVKPQLVSDLGGSWLAVWSSSENVNGTAGTDFDLLVSRSMDGGVTWSAPELLNQNGTNDTQADFNPRVATDGNGRYIVVWDSRENLGGTNGSDWDIFFTVSTDGGSSWSATKPLHSNSGTDSGDDRNPWVDTDGQGTWAVVWDSAENLSTTAGTDQDIVGVRSADGGQTWSPPVLIDAGATNDTASDFQPSIASDFSGNWVVAWSFSDSESDIHVSSSVDNALSWSPPTGLHSTNYVNDGEDFVAHVATDREGAWTVAWESGSSLNGTVDSDQDILFARSTNNGTHWTLPAALHANAATDTELDGFPWLGTDANGNWVAVWISETDLNGVLGNDSDVLMACSSDGGVTWTGPLALADNAATDTVGDFNPQVVSDRGGRWLTLWNSPENLGGTAGVDQDILLSAAVSPLFWTTPEMLNSNSGGDAGHDLNPILASDQAGNVIAVWASNEDLNALAGTDYDILYSRSTDNAVLWTPPAVLHAYANGDNQTDSNPHLAYDGSNTWIVVWDSTFNLSNTIGTDQDILFVRSVDNGVSWSLPAPVNTPTNDMAADFVPSVDGDGHGNWVAVWNSSGSATYGADFDVLSAHSTDNGVSWSPVIPLKSTSATDVDDDFDPEVATDSNGHWIGVWFSNDPLTNVVVIGDDDDILIAHSYDDGATWSSEVPLNSNAATDAAEADDFTPRLAADGLGGWIVAWHSEGMTNTLGEDHDILFTRSADGGTNWSTVGVLNATADSDVGEDDFVSVAVDERGRWLAGWNSSEPSLGGGNIAFATSFDVGTTWTVPGALSKWAMTDAGLEGGVTFARGASNTWVSAWHTTFNLGGTNGTDRDVLFARAEEPDFALNITRFVQAGGQIELRWHGGFPLYQVRWRPMLGQGGWTNVGPSTSGVSAAFPLPGQQQAFFQVISGANP